MEVKLTKKDISVYLMKPTFIMMVGISGSGKSTTAKMIERNNNDYIIVNTDKIREILFNGEYRKEDNNLVFKIAEYEILKYLKDGHNVILDATNLKSYSRKKYVEMVEDLVSTKLCIYMDRAVDKCISAGNIPEDEVVRQAGIIEVPVKEEGWDGIIHKNRKE